MTTWFVTRHQGAKDWINAQGIHIDRFENHLDLSLIQSGDTVIGVAPLNIVAHICRIGAKFFSVDLTLPSNKRGVELTLEDMYAFGAQLRQYKVIDVTESGERDE